MNVRDRDIDALQGHWLLARMGKKVLRPGGRKMTEWIIDRASVTGARVVELAPGLGVTAEEILSRAPQTYLGVDEDASAVATAQRTIADRAAGDRFRVIHGRAQDTTVASDSADVVVGEAMLTMQGDKAKAAIIEEVHRILAPGGRYAIHELALRPNDLDPAIKDSLRREMSRAIRVNARPLTAAEWTALLESHGFEVEAIRTDDMGLLAPSQLLADEGVAGVARILANIVRNPTARRRILAMRKVFTEHDKELASIGIVARVRNSAATPDNEGSEAALPPSTLT